MAKKEKKTTTLRTVSIKIEADDTARTSLSALQSAYADACNRLVPIVVETRCWNRYKLYAMAYRRLCTETPLGAQRPAQRHGGLEGDEIQWRDRQG